MVKRKTPELDKLLRDVRAITKKRGSIKLLADVLGILPQTLSDWLRGRYEPGGEVTLQMQKWVVAAEAKQKKRGGSVRAQPPLKTRTKRKSNDEKPISSGSD